MKNIKKSALASMLVLSLSACTLFAVGCADKPNNVDPPSSEPDTRPAVIKEDENAFRDYKVSDFAAITDADWTAKKTDIGIAYEFEGSYAEGFQSATTLEYFDANLYKDGSVRGFYNSTPYLGWWYNVDSYGDDCLAVQWVSCGGGAYTEMSVATEKAIGDYEWESSLKRYVSNTDTRFVTIYGREYKQAVSLEIDTAEAKTSYHPGARLDTKGLVITAVRADGSKVKIRDGKCSFDYDLSQSGSAVVKVAYDGAEGEFAVNVVALASISVDASEVQTWFKVGETFNSVGLKVKAIYDSGDEEELLVADYTVSGVPAVLDQRGEKTVTVSVGNVSDTYTISVAGISRIDVDATNVKTSYNVGDTLETDGLAIKAVYDDGDEVDIALEDCSLSRLVLDEVGESLVVNVTYMGAVGSYTIDVVGIMYTGTTVFDGQTVDMTITRITDRSAYISVDGGEAFTAGFNVNDPFLHGGYFPGKFYIVLWGIEADEYKDIPLVYSLNKDNNTFSECGEGFVAAYHGTDKIWGNEWFTCQNYHLYILNERDVLVAMEVDKGTGSGESEDKVVYFVCGYSRDGDSLNLPLTNEGKGEMGGMYSSTDSGGDYWFPMVNPSQPNSFEDGTVFWKYFTLNDDGTAVRRPAPETTTEE